MRWVKTRRVGEAKRVLKVSELNKKEKKLKYQERITDEWNAMSVLRRVMWKRNDSCLRVLLWGIKRCVGYEKRERLGEKGE